MDRTEAAWSQISVVCVTPLTVIVTDETERRLNESLVTEQRPA
jgi:hypothetical protein